MDIVCEEVIGVGVDLVSVSRMQSAISRHPRILDRLFSDAEREYCSRAKPPWERWAARFAAKEAVIKALGASPGRMPWRMISIEGGEGRPYIRLLGKAANYARSVGCDRIEISLTHHEGMAVAVAVAIRGVKIRTD
ncbi:MAG: hypothetical protein C4318_05950 [Acidimicrobiia bacterium]